jgi:glutaredoxin 3
MPQYKYRTPQKITFSTSMQPNIEIYTWLSCPYCIRAKALLNRKGVEFTEYAIDGDRQARAQMSDRANGRTSVPQIFIDDVHIGGCDDLHALDAQGKLDSLLGLSESVL